MNDSSSQYDSKFAALEEELKKHINNMYSGRLPSEFHLGLEESAVDRRHAYLAYVELSLELSKLENNRLAAQVAEKRDKTAIHLERATTRATIWIAVFTVFIAAATILSVFKGSPVQDKFL